MIQINRVRGAAICMALGSCTASSEHARPAADPTQIAGRKSDETGTLSLTLVRELKHTSYGTWKAQLCRLSDFDGDGRRDLAFLPWMAEDNDHTVSVYSLRTGQLLRTITPPTTDGSKRLVPRAMVDADDIQGDQKSDLIILDVEWSSAPALAASLSAYDMGRPVPVWSCALPAEDGLLAGSVAKIGDVNRDGISDIVVGISPWMSSTTRGRIEMRSGRDGSLLWKTEGTEPPFKFGAEVARSADADGDGIADVAVLAPFNGSWENGWSTQDPLPRLEIRSSSNGRLLRALAPTREPAVGESWMPPTPPRMLTGGGDVNGDGVSDLLLRSLKYYDNVEVLSGTDDKPISVVDEVAASPDDRFRLMGDSLDFTDDLDGDGWRDLLIGHAYVGNHNDMHGGAVYLYSSKTRARLAAIVGDWQSLEQMGTGVCWLGDTDWDGAPEFATTTARSLRIYAVQRR